MVPVGEMVSEYNGLFLLTESGKLLWEAIQNGEEKEELEEIKRNEEVDEYEFYDDIDYDEFDEYEEDELLTRINDFEYILEGSISLDDLDDRLELKLESEEYDSEIFMDVNLKHYPLRDYKGMWLEMNNIVKEYNKIGHRNSNAIERGKLGKHMMHLVRLYLMCFDIMEKGEIITYREKDHDLLMDIRNGKYLDENDQPVPEFMEMVAEYESKLDKLKETTALPEKPDYKKINEFVASVNERIVKNEI